MTNLFTDEQVDAILLTELAKIEEIPVGSKFDILKVIMCNTGAFIILDNLGLWEADVKYWIPEQRKAYEFLRSHFESLENRKNPFGDIDQIAIVTKDVKCRKVQFQTDNKDQAAFDFKETSSGNMLYEIG